MSRAQSLVQGGVELLSDGLSASSLLSLRYTIFLLLHVGSWAATAENVLAMYALDIQFIKPGASAASAAVASIRLRHCWRR